MRSRSLSLVQTHVAVPNSQTSVTFLRMFKHAIYKFRFVPIWLLFYQLSVFSFKREQSPSAVPIERNENNEIIFTDEKEAPSLNDPFNDLNIARERTQTWIGAMSNLSPAALSRLKRELEAKVQVAIEKLNSTSTLPVNQREFKNSLLFI